MGRLFADREPRELGEGLPSSAVFGSMSLHTVALIVMGWGATQVNLPRRPLVYQVELVAAPSAVSARTVPSPRRVRQPEPTPEPDPEPESEIKVPETKPAVTEKPQKEVERLEAQEEAAKPDLAPVAAVAAAAPNESEEGVVDEPVRLEGAPFPYPDYLANIIFQIKRHWRPPAGGRQLSAELAFTILRDGSVEDVSWIQRSGSAAFDLEARGSIETAGLRQAFGPLPDGYPSDQLRVSFFFDPTRY